MSSRQLIREFVVHTLTRVVVEPLARCAHYLTDNSATHCIDADECSRNIAKAAAVFNKPIESDVEICMTAQQYPRGEKCLEASARINCILQAVMKKIDELLLGED